MRLIEKVTDLSVVKTIKGLRQLGLAKRETENSNGRGVSGRTRPTGGSREGWTAKRKT